MDSEKVQFKSSYDVLRNLINMEFQRNINQYTSFLVIKSPCEEVHKYWNEKSYSHESYSAILSLTYLLTLLGPAHIFMLVAKEITIFSRILSHLDFMLSTGKSICSKGVNIINRLLIEILKEKESLKTNVFRKRISQIKGFL